MLRGDVRGDDVLVSVLLQSQVSFELRPNGVLRSTRSTREGRHVDRPHGYVPAVAPFWRREMLSSSSTGSNSWCQKSCHSPSSSKTSKAGWPGFPHLWAMVPTRPCNSALRWSFLTLTRLPICASSGLTKISPPYSLALA